MVRVARPYWRLISLDNTVASLGRSCWAAAVITERGRGRKTAMAETELSGSITDWYCTRTPHIVPNGMVESWKANPRAPSGRNLVVEPERRSEWITHLWPVKVEHSVRIQTLREAAGSLPLYERYVAGDFREAWTELAAMGDAIWQDPVAADALAVCHETMHRAKTNIELLVGALEAEGYEFHLDVYSPYWRRSQKMQEWVESHDKNAQLVVASMQEPLMKLPEPVRSQMNAERKRRLPSAMETARIFRDHRLGIVRPIVPPEMPETLWLRKITSPAGDLPLSFRAWHSTVGGVNLVGSHPELAPPGVECDPLFVAPLKCVADACDAWQEDHAGEEKRPPFRMPISPPASVKAGINDEQPHYIVTLPSATMDAVVENEPHGLRFVDYLRLAFQWGGFPGYADMPDKAPALIHQLKGRLLPI